MRAREGEQLARALTPLPPPSKGPSRWLNSQRDLLGVLELNEHQALPRYVLQGQGDKPAQGQSLRH